MQYCCHNFGNNKSVELGETPISIVTQVSLNCSIIELASNIGIHVHYQLKMIMTQSLIWYHSGTVSRLCCKMHTEPSCTCQPFHNQEKQIASKYYVAILLTGFAFIMED